MIKNIKKIKLGLVFLIIVSINYSTTMESNQTGLLKAEKINKQINNIQTILNVREFFAELIDYEEDIMPKIYLYEEDENFEPTINITVDNLREELCTMIDSKNIDIDKVEQLYTTSLDFFTKLLRTFTYKQKDENPFVCFFFNQDGKSPEHEFIITFSIQEMITFFNELLHLSSENSSQILQKLIVFTEIGDFSQREDVKESFINKERYQDVYQKQKDYLLKDYLILASNSPEILRQLYRNLFKNTLDKIEVFNSPDQKKESIIERITSKIIKKIAQKSSAQIINNNVKNLLDSEEFCQLKEEKKQIQQNKNKYIEHFYALQHVLTASRKRQTVSQIQNIKDKNTYDSVIEIYFNHVLFKSNWSNIICHSVAFSFISI